MYPANSTNLFSWLTHSTTIYIVEERLNIYSDVLQTGSYFVGPDQFALSPIVKLASSLTKESRDVHDVNAVESGNIRMKNDFLEWRSGSC